VVVSSGLRGSLGRLVAEHAAERGHQVVSTTDIEAPLPDCDAIALIPRRGDPRRFTEQATRTLVAAAQLSGTGPRFVLLSSFAVGHGVAHPLNRTHPDLLPARIEAERVVRGSRLPYTIVQPNLMDNNPPGSHALTLTQDPQTDGMVARLDVAATLVAAIEDPAAADTVFALYSEPGSPGGWPFAELRHGIAPEEIAA
jgi:uncharacterized protein YbjT (DUF2867 family)